MTTLCYLDSNSPVRNSVDKRQLTWKIFRVQISIKHQFHFIVQIGIVLGRRIQPTKTRRYPANKFYRLDTASPILRAVAWQLATGVTWMPASIQRDFLSMLHTHSVKLWNVYRVIQLRPLASVNCISWARHGCWFICFILVDSSNRWKWRLDCTPNTRRKKTHIPFRSRVRCSSVSFTFD